MLLIQKVRSYDKMFRYCFSLAAATLLTTLLLLCDLFRALFRSRQPVNISSSVQDKSLTLIMLNYNGEKMLKECLPSVMQEFDSCAAARDFWLIDNASNDDSINFIKQTYPNIRIFSRKHNDGFGHSYMSVIPEATTDKLLLLNNDIKLKPGFIRGLIDAADSEVFAVCPKLLTWDESGVNQGRVRAWFDGPEYKIDFFDTPKKKTYSLWGIGGASLFDRAKLMALGGFDDLYDPFYVEDTDLCYRAWKCGWPTLYEPKAVAIHRHKASMAKRFSEREINILIKRNLFLFLLKNLDDHKRLIKFILSQPSLIHRQASDSQSALYEAAMAVFSKIPQLINSRYTRYYKARYDDDTIHRMVVDGISSPHS